MTITPLVLPILKFSHATTSTDRTSPLGWTHISSAGDLITIFDSPYPYSSSSQNDQGGSRRLRVLRGGASLEELDITQLAREAAYPHPQNAKHPVAVIVKSPCLAIRYPTATQQIRRFQIKFASDADFTTAVSILREAGCIVSESTTIPAPSAPATTISPSPAVTSTSTVNTIYQRPPTASATASPAPSTTTTIHPIEGSLYQRPSTAPSFPVLLNPTPSIIPSPAPSAPSGGLLRSPSFTDTQSLSQALPPRRELPFARRGQERGVPVQVQSVQPQTQTQSVNSATRSGNDEETNNTAIPSTTSSSVGKHAPNGLSTADLSSYVATPASERRAWLETWICQQLDNDGFITVCEDMEQSWRRIALGL